MLTTSADNIVGTSANDSVTAIINDGVKSTLTSLDIIDGGDGVDTLNILDMGDIPAEPLGVIIKNIEVINMRSAGNVDQTSFDINGVTNLNVTQAQEVKLTAAATTAVAVTGASGKVEVTGGSTVAVSSTTGDIKVTNASTVNVTSATVGKEVEVTGSKGAVTVTAAKDAGDIKIDGATDVTVTSTVAAVSNKIDATKATGAVMVTQNLSSDGSAALTGGAITTGGGTTVTINVNATSAATKAGQDNAITIGAIKATADDKTTAITVNQNDAVTTFSTAAKDAVVATETVTFKAADQGAVIVVGGLTFTAAKALTAAEVAAAFADLTAKDTQSAGGLVTNGTYSGKLEAGWTSAAASGDTVVFTGADDETPTLAVAAGTGITSGKYLPGTAAVAEETTENAVTFGAVEVTGGKALTNLTLNGYGSATVTGDNEALATVSLTDSAGVTDITTTKATTLAVTVNNIKGTDAAAEVKLKDTLTTLNLTTAGKDSAFKLAAAGVKTLAVTGDKAANLSNGSTLSALTTVTVAGTAGLTLSDSEAATLTSVNTTATTGTVTAHIDGTKATYTGGAGVDMVQLETKSALTKAIDLGAGDDGLSFGALLVTGSTAAVAGGEGTDTLSMSAAAAAGLDDAAVTFITGFERLTINDLAAEQELDLANLGFTNHVTTTGGELKLNNLASNGTVVVTADETALTVAIKDAATGKADVLNAVLSSKEALVGNTLTAANVETVNITSTDTDKTAHINMLTLTADKATTVTVAGNAGLDLTVTGALVTLIDGSTSTGGLTAETNKDAAAATTIKGGSGADDLTANRNQDVLEGGAGNDTLTVEDGVNLATLRGGAGQDTYVIGLASNSNGYATIEGSAADLKGDTIQFAATAAAFSSAKIVLGATAVFQDYANEASKAELEGSVSWFQWAGDTYLVQDNDGAATSFVNGTDAIVKIVGTAVNFSFNADAPGLLEII